MSRAEWKQLRRELAVLQQRGWPTYVVLLVDGMSLALSAWLWGRGAPATAASVALLTLVLLHCYLWVHEASHSSLCESQAANDLLGHVAGWLIVMPYLTRRRSHLLHHAWAGHPTGDPANKRLIERFSVMTPRQAAVLERIWRSWVPLFAINDRVGLWRDAGQEWARGSQTRSIRRERSANAAYAIAYVGAAAALLASGKLFSFAAWYLPPLMVLFALEELVNAPHHAETPLLDPDDAPLPYWEQHRVTHSCRSVPLWSRCVALNFNLHTAHHVFPRLPWSALPAAQRALRGRIPALDGQQTTPNEVLWSLRKRRLPLLQIMGHYFDRIPGRNSAGVQRASPAPTPAAGGSSMPPADAAE